MKFGWVLIRLTAAAALVVILSAPVAFAAPCPGHTDPAQNAIDKAMAGMKGMSDKGKMGLVHTLIDDAKMLLWSAKHNCDKPRPETTTTPGLPPKRRPPPPTPKPPRVSRRNRLNV